MLFRSYPSQKHSHTSMCNLKDKYTLFMFVCFLVSDPLSLLNNKQKLMWEM